MVPLDLPPLIKGSSNEYRGSGRRKLGQMDASSNIKKMIVVWLIEQQKVIKKKKKGRRGRKEKKKEKKGKKKNDDRSINVSVI